MWSPPWSSGCRARPTSAWTTQARLPGRRPDHGQPPTQLDVAWFDAAQEEIARVIEGAGLTLDPGDYEQLLKAIRKLVQTTGNDFVPKDVFYTAIEGLEARIRALESQIGNFDTAMEGLEARIQALES